MIGSWRLYLHQWVTPLTDQLAEWLLEDRAWLKEVVVYLNGISCLSPSCLSLSLFPDHYEVSSFALPHPSTMMFCLTQAQNRWNQPTVDCLLWNHEPKIKPSSLELFMWGMSPRQKPAITVQPPNWIWYLFPAVFLSWRKISRKL
jgi:hypothetical protein